MSETRGELPPVAVITGGERGIGRSVAEALLSRGFTVVLGAHDNDSARQAVSELSGLGNVSSVPLDVTDDESIDRLVRTLGERFEAIDVLVNNAGITGLGGPTDIRREQLRAIFEVDAFGPAMMTSKALDLLAASAHPRIVNVSSGGGSLVRAASYAGAKRPVPILAYASAKTALNMITVQTHLAFQHDERLKHIKINCCTPGTTKTKVSGWVGQSTADGARIIVKLATLPDDGPSGGFFELEGVVPW